MRGYSDTPRVDYDTFILMDRLYGTLDDKIEEWNAVDMANKGCCGSSKDNPEVRKLLKARLLVAYDLSTAVHYLHEHRYVDFHCFHKSPDGLFQGVVVGMEI